MSYRSNNYLALNNLYNSESKQYLQTEPDKSSYEKQGMLTFAKFNKTVMKLNSSDNVLKTEGSRRIDKFGNPIVKKKGSHKISFADQFPEEGRKLSTVSKVSSFKKYNVNNEEMSRYCFSCLII